ncbi:carbamoyl-phosphate synthase L chain, ATP binding domain-containing protein [Entophlyctis helioformis]|nr:carbamoyl-phosphate synthase L chain, ATP binding domain-containing protein [Entophlyctis helioformis]
MLRFFAARRAVPGLSINRSSVRHQATHAPLFDKILIANRGEIACRVMRTAKRLGIKSVAVFSDADRNSMHVQMADEAYNIGPAASAESYLRMDKILNIAKISQSKAIHPGYGFLSENAGFAEAVAASGLSFIGPPAQSIVDMGSKSASKYIMQAANVPVVPGYHGENQSPAFLKNEASAMGYPVLIKAIKGGGGKGMRIVQSADEFDLMLESAKREAIKSFGDDKVLIEKYITRPRHVEVQVFADKLGNAVYLFERDCSVQRRHQKILEEAPAPGLTAELRASLGEKAVAAAKAVNYVGAGTVEFILDTDTNQFYFMEMNTRLQVEHPITEMITGTDLVEWQLRVAAGHSLPLDQASLRINGHAFEARIYAENPDKNFMPDTGRLVHLRTPNATNDVRIETGVRQGDEVSVHYDPMISKLVVHAEDRTEALRVLRKSLGEFEVVGPNTNIEFLKKLASHPSFISADVETGFIKRHEADLFPPKQATDPLVFAQAALFLAGVEKKKLADLAASLSAEPQSPWSSLSGLRLNSTSTREYAFLESRDSKDPVKVSVEFLASGEFQVQVKDHAGVVHKIGNAELSAAQESADPSLLVARIGGRFIQSRVVHSASDDAMHVFFDGTKHVVYVPIPAYRAVASDAGHGSVLTPMPCKISQVLVKAGDEVKAGQPLVILEAMKMEHVIKSPRDAVVERVLFNAGDLVGDGKRLLTFVE